MINLAKLKTWIKQERGQSALEYLVIVAVLVFAFLLAFSLVDDDFLWTACQELVHRTFSDSAQCTTS